jgi:hypothetical protein
MRLNQPAYSYVLDKTIPLLANLKACLSRKLLMLDGLYHTAGVMCATLILSQWR